MSIFSSWWGEKYYRLTRVYILLIELSSLELLNEKWICNPKFSIIQNFLHKYGCNTYQDSTTVDFLSEFHNWRLYIKIYSTVWTLSGMLSNFERKIWVHLTFDISMKILLLCIFFWHKLIVHLYSEVCDLTCTKYACILFVFLSHFHIALFIPRICISNLVCWKSAIHHIFSAIPCTGVCTFI